MLKNKKKNIREKEIKTKSSSLGGEINNYNWKGGGETAS